MVSLLFFLCEAYSEEKFLNVKGIVKTEGSGEPVSDYSIKIVQDKLDSATQSYTKPEFQIWAPANRRSTLYFIKPGYVTKSIYVDASYIPSIAFKVKQQIDIEIEMTPIEKVGRRDFSKPIMTAQYNASSNDFHVDRVNVMSKSTVSSDYSPPFPAPVDTYKGVQPTNNTLTLTALEDLEKKASTSELKSLIEGVLFADLNYCFFNERTNDANVILKKLALINPETWAGLKPFDSPEYGKIIMRTINREQGVDTLFAIGSNIECSRLIFENFTSDSKILVHLKKIKEVYPAFKLNSNNEQLQNLTGKLSSMIPLITEIEKKYTESLRTKSDFNLEEDTVFQELKSINTAVYQVVIQ